MGSVLLGPMLQMALLQMAARGELWLNLTPPLPLAAAAAGAAAGGGAPDPPLVKVADGAADLYADLFGGGDDGSGGVLLKTQVAEVSSHVGGTGWVPFAAGHCSPSALRELHSAAG